MKNAKDVVWTSTDRADLKKRIKSTKELCKPGVNRVETDRAEFTAHDQLRGQQHAVGPAAHL